MGKIKVFVPYRISVLSEQRPNVSIKKESMHAVLERLGINLKDLYI
jgi:hypothetical protein